MRIIIIIGIILLAGCEEPMDLACEIDNQEPVKQIWIDYRCSDRVVELTEDAIDEINDFGHRHMCRDLVALSGRTDSTGKASVQCRPGYYNDGIAHANEHTVSLYPAVFDGADNEWVRSVVLHELTHWIGVHDHSYERDANMYHQMIGIDHYTVADRDLICGQLGCIN